MSDTQFAELAMNFETFAATLGLHCTACVPINPVDGGDVLIGSDAPPWYAGQLLIEDRRRYVPGKLRIGVIDIGRYEHDLRAVALPVAAKELNPVNGRHKPIEN